jgi:hypothetical protein
MGRATRPHRRLALSAQQVTDETTVHDRNDVVSQRSHQRWLVTDNVSQGDREGLGCFVGGERSDYRFSFGFCGGTPSPLCGELHWRPRRREGGFDPSEGA